MKSKVNWLYVVAAAAVLFVIVWNLTGAIMGAAKP